jgi:hypothetical protein
VDLSIEFDDQPQLMAVEVDDVTAKWLLSTKLQSECSSASQQVPINVFSECFGLPECSS